MEQVSLAVTLWLGSMFVYSAGQKLVTYDRAGSLVKPYRVLPTKIAYVIGLALPWAELMAGGSLLLGLSFPAGPMLGAVLGFSFAYASLQVLRRKENVPCGCSGAGNDRVNRATLARALLIAASSALILNLGPVQMPLPVAVLLVLVSFVPAARNAHHRLRISRERRRHAGLIRQEVVRLEHVLAAPPPGALFRTLVQATAGAGLVPSRGPTRVARGSGTCGEDCSARGCARQLPKGGSIALEAGGIGQS